MVKVLVEHTYEVHDRDLFDFISNLGSLKVDSQVYDADKKITTFIILCSRYIRAK